MHRTGPRQRAIVIYNPVAGARRRRRLKRVLDLLCAAGVAIALSETRRRGDAEQAAARVAAAKPGDRPDIVIAAGGDGTINEVVNGLAGAPVPMAIIPLGTANVLSHELGLGTDPKKIAETILYGRGRPLYLGLANGRRFVMMAGAGFDAHVVEHVDLALKRSTGPFAYVLETVEQALAYRFGLCTVSIDGVERQAASAVICNGRKYGGPFVAAHEADVFAPRLFVCLLKKPGILHLIRYSWGLIAGRLRYFRDVEIVPATKIRVLASTAWPLQADGDVIARLPVEITLAPETLTLIAPG